MGRMPSEKTQLRQAKSELRRWKERWQAAQTEANQQRAKAAYAEQEAADWRRRFDLLLIRTPALPPPRNDGEKLQRCVDLLRQNPEENYVSSIKLYRELFGASLVDAKNAMEAERNKLRSPVNGT